MDIRNIIYLKKLNISPSTVDRYLKDKNNPYKELSYKK